MGFFKKSSEQQASDTVDVDGWLDSANAPSDLPADSDDDQMVDVGEVLSTFTADPPPPPPLPNGPFAYDPSKARPEPDAPTAAAGPGMWHFPELDEGADQATEMPEVPVSELAEPAVAEVPVDEAEPVGFGFEAEVTEGSAAAETETTIEEEPPVAAVVSGSEIDDESLEITPSVHVDDDGVLRVSDSPQTSVLLGILGLDGSPTWDEVSAARKETLATHDPEVESDPERAALALSVRRETNTAYVALRLLAVP